MEKRSAKEIRRSAIDFFPFFLQIYRGPSEKKGYDYFAPWGYYVTVPEDLKKKKYH